MSFIPYQYVGVGGGRQTILLSGSPFATKSALIAASQSSPNQLFNSNSQVTIAVVAGDPTPSNNGTFEWTGATGSYNGDFWVDFNGLDAQDIKALYESNPNTNAFTNNQKESVNSALSLTAGVIPVSNGVGFTDSPITQQNALGINVDGTIQTTKDTLYVGQGMSISEDGLDIRADNIIENISALPIRTILNNDGTTGQNLAIVRTNRQTSIIQPVDTTVFTGTLAAFVPVTATRIVKQLIVRFAAVGTGIRITLRDAANQTQTNGPILYQSHTTYEWQNGGGFSVPATGDFVINIQNSAKFVQGRFVYVVAEQSTQGTGSLEIKGAVTTIAGISQFYPYLAQTFVSEAQAEIALKNDTISNVVAGNHVTIDYTDPRNPVISSTGGGGGGGVQADWTEQNTSNAAYIKNKPTALSSFTNDAAVSALFAGSGIDVDATNPRQPAVSIDPPSVASALNTLTGASRVDALSLKNLDQLPDQSFTVADVTKSPTAAAIRAGVDPVIDAKAATAAAAVITNTYNALNTTQAPTASAINPQIQSQATAAAAAVITTTFNTSNTTQSPTAGAIQPVITSAVSQATVGRRQLGTWNATSNTPTLANPPSSATYQQGDFYDVSTAGAQFGMSFAVGDRIVVGIDTSGNLIWFKSALNVGTVDNANLFVSNSGGLDSNVGTLALPKKTISAAYLAASQPSSITVATGGYTENITANKQNIVISGQGVNANNNAQLNGSITASAARFRMRWFQIVHSANAGFTWNDTTGSHHFEECSFVGSAASFYASSSARGFASLVACDFSGSTAAANVVLTAVSAVNSLTISNCNGVRLSVGAGWIVYVSGCPSLQIVNNSGTIVYVDTGLINVNSMLTSQAQLTALLSDTNVATDGYYICNFASPSVGARGDVLLKISAQGVATSVLPHRTFQQAPSSVAVFNGATFDSYVKVAGLWQAAGAGAGITTVTMAERSAINTAKTVFNSTTNILESYDGVSWRPLSPVNIYQADPASIVSVGIYTIINGTPPSISQNGTIGKGDIFLFDGSQYWLLYKWVDAPSSIYINAAMYVSGGTQYQTLLKSNSVNSWYYSPTPQTTDTGILFAKKLNSTNGTPAAPYQMAANDYFVSVDDANNAVGVQMPLIASVATNGLTRRYNICRPRSVSSQTVLVKASGTDVFVGGPVGRPSGENQLFLSAGESLSVYAAVDPVIGNVWMVDSYDGLDSGALRFDSTITTNSTLTAWGRMYYVSAQSGSVVITLPISAYGRAGSYIKLIRTDTNQSNTVTVQGQAGYAINGKSSLTIPVLSSADFNISTNNTTQIVCEMMVGNTVTPQFCWVSKGSGTLSAGAWRDVFFASSDAAYRSVDPESLHSGTTNTNRVTVKQSGIYKITCGSPISSGWTGIDAGVSLLINGNTVKVKWQGRDLNNAAWIRPDIEFSYVAYLSAGDYVSIQVYSGGSGTYTLADPFICLESLNFQGMVNSSPSESVVGSVAARRQSTGQTIASAVDVVVNFDTADAGFSLLPELVGVSYSSGVFTNTSSSKIALSVSAQIQFSANNNGGRYTWAQLSDGSRAGYTVGFPKQGGDSQVNCVNCIITLAAGASFTIRAWQDSGVALNLNAGGQGGLNAGYAGRISVCRMR